MSEIKSDKESPFTAALIAAPSGMRFGLMSLGTWIANAACMLPAAFLAISLSSARLEMDHHDAALEMAFLLLLALLLRFPLWRASVHANRKREAAHGEKTDGNVDRDKSAS